MTRAKDSTVSKGRIILKKRNRLATRITTSERSNQEYRQYRSFKAIGFHKKTGNTEKAPQTKRPKRIQIYVARIKETKSKKSKFSNLTMAPAKFSQKVMKRTILQFFFVLPVLLGCAFSPVRFGSTRRTRFTTESSATLAPPQDTINVSNEQSKNVLESLSSLSKESSEYAREFGLSQTEAAVYAVFQAIRKANTPLGLKGEPFVLRRDDILKALNLESSAAPFDHFFTLADFAKAVEDDFLDAARGSTKTSTTTKGWQVRQTMNKGMKRKELQLISEIRLTFRLQVCRHPEVNHSKKLA